MKDDNQLVSVFNSFMNIKSECRCKIICDNNISDLTLKQIEYLQKLDQYEYVTTSKLADTLNLSKPSVTEMIKKFIELDCVSKERCCKDARVFYIHLTERGKRIARYEELASEKFIKRIEKSLTDDDISTLVRILSKVE